jgi:16S rRNA (cytosine967-C5)-methyltransferase
MINARRLAYQILLNLEKHSSYPDRLIRGALQRQKEFREEDRALLTELVYGVVRWQGLLDWHLDQLIRTKPQKVAPEIRILLRLALYQILHLNRIPEHAAVNEAVKIAKSTQPAHLAGFVNAVLREAIRRNGKWEWPPPETKPEEFLAVTTSHPSWFARRCMDELGFEEALSLCRANNSIAPLVIRVNTIKTSTLDLMGALHEKGLNVQQSPYLPDALRLSGLRRDIAQLSCHEQGWSHVQDEASQLVSVILDPLAGERVLDLCAGFGGKSSHIANLMGNEGEIVAVDQSSWKLHELQQNARRQAIRSIKTIASDALDLRPEQLGNYDRVLLDAPCSGFGTLRRKPDIKWRRHPKDPYRFSRLQRNLLEHASLFVKKGGILVYATCTFFSEEDEQVAGDFCKRHEDWALESAADFLPKSCKNMVEGSFFKSWPHRHNIDGFFAARWRRME